MNVHFDPNALGLRDLSMSERTLTALLGYAVVFAGLLLLMAIVYGMGAFFKARARKASEASPKPVAAPAVSRPAPSVPQPKTAPGTAGEVKLFDVPDKEAAMIMAIVADQMGKPLNELRFKSIKEVKNDEV